MKMTDGGKGDSPRKQQDQKAYEEGWDRIFSKKPKRNVYDEIVEGFESMKTQKQEDDCND